ncbi:MAG: YraN family protein [Bacteroidetes bacterium]|nr:MAG: YraN family protein [Bacteroidota bacterium]
MKLDQNAIGQLGEDLAAQFLTTQGCRILERNWHYKKSEIDLIVMQNKTLVMVEVKTKKDLRFGLPEEYVSLKKQQLMEQAMQAYLGEAFSEAAYRFDIVSVVLQQGNPEINWIQDAFDASDQDGWSSI